METRAALTAYWQAMKAAHAELAKLRAGSERGRRRDRLQILPDRFRILQNPGSSHTAGA